MNFVRNKPFFFFFFFFFFSCFWFWFTGDQLSPTTAKIVKNIFPPKSPSLSLDHQKVDRYTHDDVAQFPPSIILICSAWGDLLPHVGSTKWTLVILMSSLKADILLYSNIWFYFTILWSRGRYADTWSHPDLIYLFFHSFLLFVSPVTSVRYPIPIFFILVKVF